MYPPSLVTHLEASLRDYDQSQAPARDVVLTGLRWDTPHWPELALAWLEQGLKIDAEIAACLETILKRSTWPQGLKHRAQRLLRVDSDARVAAFAAEVERNLQQHFGHTDLEAGRIWKDFHAATAPSLNWVDADYYEHEGVKSIALEAEFFHQSGHTRASQADEFLEFRKRFNSGTATTPRSTGEPSPEVDWVKVSREGHELSMRHGRNAHTYAARLAEEAAAAGDPDAASFWRAVSSSLAPRT